MTSRPAPLLRPLAVQARVIRALLLREVITRFGRRNLGVLWLVAEPMLFTLGVSLFWKAGGLDHGSALPIEAFAITGYSSVLMWRNTVGRCTSAIQQNLGLLYHRNVQVFDVFLARAILEAVGVTASFALLSIAFTLAGKIAPPVDPFKVVLGLVLLAWFGAALGLLVGSAVAYSDLVYRFWIPTSYLLFPLSGAAFMVEWLPPGGREFVLWLPMVHGVELLRDGYFGHVVRTHYDLTYLCAANLALMFFGLLLMRNATERLERQ